MTNSVYKNETDQNFSIQRIIMMETIDEDVDITPGHRTNC